jgi:ribosomal protein L14
LDRKVTKVNKVMLELKGLQDHRVVLDHRGDLEDQGQREKGETLDFQDQQGVMVSQVDQDYQVHRDRLESQVRMELKEIWEHLAKKASRAPKDL